MTSGADAAARSDAEEMPAQVTGRRSVFDNFATHTSQWVSKGWFFTICVLVVVLWVPTLWVLPSVDTWQLVINTVTTIITFLLVAVAEHSVTRRSGCVTKAQRPRRRAVGSDGRVGRSTPGNCVGIGANLLMRSGWSSGSGSE